MLNLDFNLNVVINAHDQDWQSSPAQGVMRKRFAFQDAERGHATSLVRFESGARFNQHNHPGGEEILVLEGVFSDESGDYPAGTYLRNPVGYIHAPFTNEGCTLFVKLHQFQPGDTEHIVIDTETAEWQPGQGGLMVLPLHNFACEHTALVKWPAGERFSPHQHMGGEEIFVIAGELIDEHGRYPAGTWVRSPHLSSHCPYVEQETLIFVKTGHLIAADANPDVVVDAVSH